MPDIHCRHEARVRRWNKNRHIPVEHAVPRKLSRNVTHVLNATTAGQTCSQFTSVFDRGRLCLHCYSTFILMDWLVYATLIITYLLLCMLILLLTSSVTAMQNLFRQCKIELKYLDMAINLKKTHCIRIGHRCSAITICKNIKLWR